MSIFGDTLRHSLDDAGITYEADSITLCEEYYKLVYEANKHMNLTRITDEADAARQHFADAIKVLKYINMPLGSTVIDVGTGAGFPGMPVKIIRPDINLTLLDSSEKKTDFIKASAEKLGVDVTVTSERAEDAAQGPLRESFDFCFSRAVASLNMLLELCTPFVRTGGTFAAWKGESFESEIAEAQNALEVLSCRITSTHFIDPGSIILIEKQKPLQAKYPRRFSKIKSNPL